MSTVDPHQLLSTWANLPHLLMIYGASSAGNKAVKGVKRFLRTVPEVVDAIYNCALRCHASRARFRRLKRRHCPACRFIRLGQLAQTSAMAPMSSENQNARQEDSQDLNCGHKCDFQFTNHAESPLQFT